MDTAIRKISTLTYPLRKARDVEELELGAKTAAKVIEIVETGALRANKNIKQDPDAQTILKVSCMWQGLLMSARHGSVSCAPTA